MNEYEPGHFADVANTPFGRDIWEFLNKHTIQLELASDLHHPAVEGMTNKLETAFGDPVRSDRIKQMIGHMIRQVLEQRGFRHSAKNVKTRFSKLFSTGSRYERIVSLYQ